MSSFFFGSKNLPKSFSPFLFLSFANTVLFFTFLAPFFWNSQKCPISQNEWCPVKTKLKNSIQTIFKGVVHEQPWSSIVCLLWLSSIVSSFFWKQTFSKIIISVPFPFLCYSFCLLLSSILLASSPWFLWRFYGILTTFLWKFYVISMVFLWYSMLFLKVCLL